MVAIFSAQDWSKVAYEAYSNAGKSVMSPAIWFVNGVLKIDTRYSNAGIFIHVVDRMLRNIPTYAEALEKCREGMGK
jgi:hypothetical protein